MLNNLSVSTIMIIVWAVVIAVSLFLEIMTYELVTIFFIPAALICLILAATGVIWWVHIIVFVTLAIATTLTLRPVLKRILIKPTIPTTVTETEKGTKHRLLETAVDGKSLIKINGVEWTAIIEGGLNLEKDEVVEIIKAQSNTFLVKPVTVVKEAT